MIMLSLCRLFLFLASLHPTSGRLFAPATDIIKTLNKNYNKVAISERNKEKKYGINGDWASCSSADQGDGNADVESHEPRFENQRHCCCCCSLCTRMHRTRMFRAFFGRQTGVRTGSRRRQFIPRFFFLSV